MSKILKFKAKIIRPIYDTPDYKIYATIVSSKEYPDIHSNKYGNVTISGELSDLSADVEYEIEATEEETKYGFSYKVINIRRDVPKTEEEMFLFLNEILTENQAKTLWEVYPDIVDRVKNNRLDDIDLNKLKGIKQYTFNVIKEKIIENFCLADLVIEFQGLLTLSMIKKIYNKYTSVDKLKLALKENPYKCLCNLAGVGFKTADATLLDIEKISKANIENGKEPIIDFDTELVSSLQRCLACIIYLLEENENEGHTKTNLVELRKQVIHLTPACAHHFVDAIKDSSVYYNKEKLEIALKNTYDIEQNIAFNISQGLSISNNIWDYDIEKYRIVEDSELSDEQMQVLRNVCRYNVSILNGAAGCGKSFSTQALINMLKEHNKSFKLFSPTGKAAKVLSDFTKYPASTIHRGLGYSPIDGWFYNEEHKLNCDVLIIDEFSMVDIFLFNRVIKAIDFNYTKLLLIGDNAQLPSVSCGNLLHDFMETHMIPTVTLTKVFRYGEGGLMKVATDMRMSKKYLDNSMKKKMTSFGSNKDYLFVDLPSEAITSNVVNLYQKLLDKGHQIDEIQVLTAKNIGDCGTLILNNAIQKIANTNYGSEDCIKVGEVTYYEGDLIIQKANNYKAIVVDEFYKVKFNDFSEKEETAFIANGETGIIKKIFQTYAIIDFDGVLVKYYRDNLLSIGLGYSITIHKSQGSSIKVVILCTPQSHIFMLNSNLIYVGLTRMKKQCYHLGALDSVNIACGKKANLTRNTFMQELLKGCKEHEKIK